MTRISPNWLPGIPFSEESLDAPEPMALDETEEDSVSIDTHLLSDVNVQFISALKQTCLIAFHWLVQVEKNKVIMALESHYAWDSVLRPLLMDALRALLAMVLNRYETLFGHCSIQSDFQTLSIQLNNVAAADWLGATIYIAFAFIQGERLYYNGWLDEAKEQLKDTEETYTQWFKEHEYLFPVYRLLGDIHVYLGGIEIALNYYEKGKCLAVTLQIPQTKFVREQILFTVKCGEIALQSLHYEKAATYFLQAQRLCEENKHESATKVLAYAVRINQLRLQCYQGNDTQSVWQP